MPPALTLTIILTAELTWLAYLAIPYAWERFIAFGQARFDDFYVEAMPWGDVIELPVAAQMAGEGRKGATTGLAQQDDIARHRDGGL